MKCMFKSLVSLVVVALMLVGIICPAAMAEDTSSNLLKPYLSAAEAVRLVEIVLDTKVEYTVDEGEVLILNGETTQEVESHDEGYRIDKVFEAAEDLEKRHDWCYTESGVRHLLNEMGAKAHVKASDDESYLLVTINDGEYSLVLPIEECRDDYYMVEVNNTHDLICWMIAVNYPENLIYSKMQRENNSPIFEYLDIWEVVWLTRTLQPELKIWFEENGQITLVGDVEVALLPAYAEEGSYDYRLDEVFNAVYDTADGGKVWYFENSVFDILNSLEYRDACIEVIPEDDGHYNVRLDEDEQFVVQISAVDGETIFSAKDLYDGLFRSIVGEDFSYEE